LPQKDQGVVLTDRQNRLSMGIRAKIAAYSLFLRKKFAQKSKKPLPNQNKYDTIYYVCKIQSRKDTQNETHLSY
jgi:hypothetical protein